MQLTDEIPVKFCKFCWLDEGESSDQLVQPCKCIGTNASVHTTCLKQWISVRGNNKCAFCQEPYTLQFKKNSKTFYDWITCKDDTKTKCYSLLIVVITLAIAATLVPATITKLGPIINGQEDFTVWPVATIALAALSLILMISLVTMRLKKSFVEWKTQNFVIDFI